MESQEYDIAIVGGGIIGLSTAMHLMERFPRLRVAVVEKETSWPPTRPATTAA